MLHMTQLYTLEGKQVLEKVAEIKREKAEKEKAKEEENTKQQEKIAAFRRCKEDCVLWQ